MAAPSGGGIPSSLSTRNQQRAPVQPPHRPTEGLLSTQSTVESIASTQGEQAGGKKRRNHRAGKRKKSRRQSFLPADDEGDPAEHLAGGSTTSTAARPPFYRLAQSGGRNLSETSIASEALLDHRDQPPLRARRDSRVAPSPFARRSNHDLPTQHKPARQDSHDGYFHRRRSYQAHASSAEDSDTNNAPMTDRTPLLNMHHHDGTSASPAAAYGLLNGQYQNGHRDSRNRRESAGSITSSKRRALGSRHPSLHTIHDVNNPPSVPSSPKLGPNMGYDDVMVTNSFTSRSPDERRGMPKDQIINIDDDAGDQLHSQSSPSTPRQNFAEQRRHTIAVPAEEDVCFPVEGMSVIGEEDYLHQDNGVRELQGARRRRFRPWPDLSVFEDWSRVEKEERSEGIRTKTAVEPEYVGGRLRPGKHVWHRTEEDAPYRFTYFNEEIPSTIHSQTISELVHPGQDFRELFIPDPPELSEDECSCEEEDLMSHQGGANDRQLSPNDLSRVGTRHSSLISGMKTRSPEQSGDATPARSNDPSNKEKEKRYGDRPTFWLDILSPTDAEMRVISKTFGIHPLTAEDIMMQEAREKVELFPKYYFVNYRTFEQDMSSEDYLEPVNMYVVVFPEGIISFHFSMTPHPANVRRRIRQLKEYLQPSSDWISYALIDDITDVFAPLIQSIEEEVDDIDDAILRLITEKEDKNVGEKAKNSKGNDEKSDAGDAQPSGGDMLRRVGEGRKKVMLLYRLLGNKADVIKGFAKRCNERWQIAPKSDIGLYLGDIQDHILTMTGNLGHYETLLSRAHSNFLAQMNIRMNERQEKTADVLGKLTVLGTIVLPMNIITGMWGMNVLVPGQDVDNLYWFWSITAGLLIFGVSCFFIAKRVYGIV